MNDSELKRALEGLLSEYASSLKASALCLNKALDRKRVLGCSPHQEWVTTHLEAQTEAQLYATEGMRQLVRGLIRDL